MEAVEAAIRFRRDPCQGVEYSIELQFAIARKYTRDPPLINEQADPIALPQKHLGQRGSRTRSMLKQAVVSDLQICLLAGIQNQADISDLFLLEFFGKEFVRVPGCQAPI